VRDLTQIFEETSPFPDGVRSDWDAVLRDARRRVRRGPVGALALAVIAAAALALFWPFGNGQSGGILDRALAAAGDGPVVHLVVREGWGGTLVDLESGARTPVYAEHEFWYDPARGLHEIGRLGGQQLVDVLHQAGAVPSAAVREFQSLARDYRSSLRSGGASVLGPDILEGTPVYWIRISESHNVDAGRGYRFELGEDIAVSQDDYRPVAMRETLDGKPSPAGPSRILDYETFPAGSGDFTVPPPLDVNPGDSFRLSLEGSLEPAEAAVVLPALWDGDRLGEFPRARISKLDWAERRAGASEWTNHVDGIRFEYGTGSPALSALPGGPIQNSDGPYVVMDEFPPNESTAMWRFEGYEPPAGDLYLQGKRGLVLTRGVAVSIIATSPDLIVQAARALEPIPSG
jgi:hypothetical protein